MSTHARIPTRELLNKVPQVTLWFWIIKVLCTTVGETAADYLNVNLNLGLTGTSVVTGVLLLGALVLQFGTDRYVPARYWSAVTLVSVFGTLVTDNLTDSIGLPLETSTIIFGTLLAVTFTAWYATEKTLSIHSITTRGREAFYWAAILFTFAMGTATGDLMAEALGLGYLVTGVIVAVVIAVTAVAWRLGMHSVLAFWIIYILTRPLGASIGDLLSQSTANGGLGLGATVTSVLFLAAILGIVIYLSITKADVIRADTATARTTATGPERGGLGQTVAVLAVFAVLGGTGYAVRTAALQAEITASVDTASAAGSAPASPLGDISEFRTITQDTLDLVRSGDQAGATTRVTDLETAWDDAQSRLKPRDGAAWTEVDDKIDTVLRALRSTSPDPAAETTALTTLLGALA